MDTETTRDRCGRLKDRCACWNWKMFWAKACIHCRTPEVNRSRPNVSWIGAGKDKSIRAARMREYMKVYRPRIKELVFAALGGKRCARCGFDDERALTFDHRDGGGTQQRKKLGGGMNYYNQMLREPSKFRVLCWNCNWIVHRYPEADLKAVI